MSGSGEQPVRDPDPDKAADHEEHDRSERESPGSPEARNEAPGGPPDEPASVCGSLADQFLFGQIDG